MAFHPRLIPYLAFLVLPLLFVGLRGIFYTEIYPIFTRSIVAILFGVGLIAKLIVWCQQHNYTFSDQQEAALAGGRVEHLLTRHYHKIAVVVFGLASLWFTVIVSLNDFYCFDNFKNYTAINASCDDCEEKWFGLADEISRVVLGAIEIVFYIVSIPFLIFVSKICHRNRNSHWSYPVILFDISANISMWLYVFFNETGWHVMPAVPEKDRYEKPIGKACKLHRTPIDKFVDGDVEHLFYPCFMEMALVSVEILSHVWFASTPSGPSDDNRGINRTRDTPLPRGRIPTDIQQEEPQHSMCADVCARLKNVLGSIWNGLLSLNSPYSAFICMVINGAMLQDFSLNYSAVEKHNNSDIKYMDATEFEIHMELPVALYRICICYLPVCAVSLHLWNQLRKHSVQAKRPNEMNITYVILTICCTAVILQAAAKFVLVGMDIYKNHKSLDSDIPMYILTIMESLLILIQCLSQFGIIYLAHSHRLFEPVHKVENLFYYLAAFNFAQWALNSFMETGYLTHRIEIDPNVVPAWNAIVHICMPLITYFRYIGTFLTLDAKTCIDSDMDIFRARFRVRRYDDMQDPFGQRPPPSYRSVDERSALLQPIID